MKSVFVSGLWKINLMHNKKAFTLIEVLISIMLLSLVLMALYRSADILRASNKNLFNHLERSSGALKGSKTLYMDILQSDGNITIISDEEFHQLLINNTKNSLYGLYGAKVTWLVHKKENTLLRIEGGEYTIPLKLEERVSIDIISKKMEVFKIYRGKKHTKLLIVSKTIAGEPQSFMLQNIPIEKFKRPLVNPNSILRNGTSIIEK